MKEIWSSDCRFQKKAWLHPEDKCLRKWLITSLLPLAIPSEQPMCSHLECQLLCSPPWAPLSHPFCVGTFCTVSLYSCHNILLPRGLRAIHRSPKHQLSQLLSISVPEHWSLLEYPSTLKLPNLDTFGTRSLQKA